MTLLFESKLMHDVKCKFAIIIAIAFAPLLVQAQCEGDLRRWATELNSKGNVDLEKATCKAWPANPALTIAVLPLPNKNNDIERGAYDLEVLVSDSVTGAVIAQIYQTSNINYYAIRLTGVAIDTARYQLTASKRAFGVRVSYSGSSGIFPFDTTSLNLYVVDDQALRLVLNQFVVETRNGDWDGVCKGTFDEISSTIEIGAKGVGGYASLKIAEKNIRSVSEMLGGGCVTKNKSNSSSNSVFVYKNGYYSVSKRMTMGF